MFGRFGRSDAEGAFATCHCLTLPESEPGYYFWRDRSTGQLTRRSEWFVTKTPVVRVGPTVDQVPDLVRAAALLRSDADAIAQARALSATPAGGWRSSTRSCTSSITSIPKPAASASWPMRTARARARTGRRSTKRSRRWCAAICASDPDPAVLRFPAVGLRVAATSGSAAWSRRRSGIFRPFRSDIWKRCTALPVGCRREGRATQAADAAAALHGRRSAHPSVHRQQHAPTAREKGSIGPPERASISSLPRHYDVTRRAPGYRVDQYGGDELLDAHLSALTRRVDELVAADRDADVRRARGATVEKNTRSPGCRLVVPGPARPCTVLLGDRRAAPGRRAARTRTPTKPLQSKPDGSVPPFRYGAPRKRERGPDDRVRSSRRRTGQLVRAAGPRCVVGAAGRGVGKGAGTAPVVAQPRAPDSTRISDAGLRYRIISARIIGLSAGVRRARQVQLHLTLLETILLRANGSLTA